MSFGGWVMHWALLLLLVIAIPFDSLGRIALVSSVFGFIAYATFIETGILRQTLSGADPEETLNQLTAKTFQQATIAGTVGGLFALAALS
jgi:amino acid transporter